MPPTDPKEIAVHLSRHGLRCTRQRVALYEAMACDASHPTAERLHECVRDEHTGVSLATVYNTLEVFCRHGLARKLSSPSTGGAGAGAARFDADVSNHVHVRDADGAVHDLSDDVSQHLLDRLPANTIARIERDMGVTIDQVHIELIAK